MILPANVLNSNLPIIILLIPQLHQQVTSHIFEYFFMFVSEIFFPFTSLTRTESRGFFRVDGCFEGIQNQLSGSGKRGAGEEVIHNAGQSRGAGVDQILKMNRQHFLMIKPAKIRREAICDIREFDIRIPFS